MLRRAVSVLFCAFAVAAAFAAVRAASFVNQPFPGFLIYPNCVVSAFGSDDWPGVLAGLDAWDIVREVDGVRVASAGEILDSVRRHPPGTLFTYTIERRGETSMVVVPSIPFQIFDFMTEPLPFLATGVIFGLAGLFACLARPSWRTMGFATFGLAVGAALLRLDFLVKGAGAYALQPMLPLVPAALVHLALVFPERPPFLVRRPGLLILPYGLSLLLGTLRGGLLFRAPELWIHVDQLAFLYCAVACVFVLGMFLHAALRSADPAARERARVVMWGLLPAVVLSAVGAVIRYETGSRAAISLLPLAGAWAWIGALMYAAVKQNIFEFEIYVRRTITLTIIAVVTVVAYAGVLALSYGVLRFVGYSNRVMVPLLAVLFAIPMIPGLFTGMQRRVESRLFPLRVRLVEVVRGLSEDLSRLMATEDLADKVHRSFTERVGVSRAIIYVTRRSGLLALAEGAPSASPAVDPIVRNLERGEAISIFGIGGPRGRPTLEWMREHGFTLLLPLIARSRLEGILALGEPPGGRVFNSQDIDTLAALASRIAISLANADAYDRIRDLEERQREENQALREELELHPGFPEIIGRSGKMLALFRMIEQVAAADSTVLLLGETGTGKELVARAIHVRSARRDGPLVKVNCSAIPAGLIESELFGHEKGSFTGAIARRRGRFELAQRGTIFLDEIGELPLDVQAKILRVVQEREFERVGGSETLRAEARVIVASNRNLQAEVAAGRFREDLFFRLNVFPIRIPLLRERSEDIPLLVDHFIARFNARLKKRVMGVSERSRIELLSYPWPGNVRELENVIERAMVLSDGPVLSTRRLDAPPSARDAEMAAPVSAAPLSEVLRAVKVAAIDRALSTGGNQVRAAELLGLKPPSLSRMLRDLGMRR